MGIEGWAKRPYLLWLDLETSGQTKNFGEDHILEIGCSLTDLEMNEVDSRQYILPIAPEMIERMPDIVLNMHTVNGLLEDCKQIPLPEGAENIYIGRALMLSAIDIELTKWVKSYVGNNHIPLAGSGISHFDRKYVERDLPNLAKRLTYKNADIGVVRWFMELANVHLTAGDSDVGDKTHRALDDARVHSQEAKRWIGWAKWSGNPPT